MTLLSKLFFLIPVFILEKKLFLETIFRKINSKATLFSTSKSTCCYEMAYKPESPFNFTSYNKTGFFSFSQFGFSCFTADGLSLVNARSSMAMFSLGLISNDTIYAY